MAAPAPPSDPVRPPRAIRTPVGLFSLLALGMSLARRGILPVASIAICVSTTFALSLVTGVLSSRGPQAPAHDVPLLASSALAWGGGFLLAFAAAAHALRRDRAEGIRALFVARTTSLRGYLLARVGGLAVLIALCVAGGTLVCGLVGAPAQHVPRRSPHAPGDGRWSRVLDRILRGRRSDRLRGARRALAARRLPLLDCRGVAARGGRRAHGLGASGGRRRRTLHSLARLQRCARRSLQARSTCGARCARSSRSRSSSGSRCSSCGATRSSSTVPRWTRDQPRRAPRARGREREARSVAPRERHAHMGEGRARRPRCARRRNDGAPRGARRRSAGARRHRNRRRRSAARSARPGRVRPARARAPRPASRERGLRARDAPPRRARDDRARRGSSPLGIESLAERRVRSLSPGEARAVSLAIALSSRAPVLLIEEPLAALEPSATARVLEVLRARATAGACIIVTTASVRDATSFADQLGMLTQGVFTHLPPALAHVGVGGARLRVVVAANAATEVAPFVAALAAESGHRHRRDGDVRGDARAPCGRLGRRRPARISSPSRAPSVWPPRGRERRSWRSSPRSSPLDAIRARDRRAPTGDTLSRPFRCRPDLRSDRRLRSAPTRGTP